MADVMFRCPFQGCDKEFYSERGLRKHIRSHQASEPIQCGLGTCKQTFATDSDRNEHIRTVHSVESTGATENGADVNRDTSTCQVVSKDQDAPDDITNSCDAGRREGERDDLRDIIQNGEYLASQLAIARVSTLYSLSDPRHNNNF